MVVIPGPEKSPGFLSLCHKQRAHILIFMARNKQQKGMATANAREREI